MWQIKKRANQSFRIDKALKYFYNEIEHANKFMIDTIKNIPE